MLDRGEAEELIEDLSGDEHTWVDFKEDYYVLGIEPKKADFIKDIAAMANTITEHSTHYIIIGVNDDSGELAGVSDNFDDKSDPRHILSVDEADIQKVLTEYLSPTPNVTLNKFTDEEPRFGVLSINQAKKKPCTIQKSIYFNGDRKLQEGLIYFRSGSSNTIALRAEIERMIDERVQNRRSDILDGIRKATEIGPEAVATVGDIVHEEGEGEIVVEIGEEGDFVLEEWLSREPLTDLDERLTLELKRWATTDTINIDRSSLWEYYSKPEQISIDEQSVLFLTQASLNHSTYGAFWLSYVDISKIRDILISSSNGTHRNEDISIIFAALGDKEGLQEFYDELSESTTIAPFPKYRDIVTEGKDSRIEQLVEKKTYRINHDDWRKSIDLQSLDEDEIKETIQIVASHLESLEGKWSGRDRWFTKRNQFRKCLKDIELTYSIKKSGTE